MSVLNRVISLLLSAVAVFVLLSVLGFVVYAGIFIFLGVVLYLLVVTVKDEFFKQKNKQRIETSRIIDMGEVEIIPPEKTKR